MLCFVFFVGVVLVVLIACLVWPFWAYAHLAPGPRLLFVWMRGGSGGGTHLCPFAVGPWVLAWGLDGWFIDNVGLQGVIQLVQCAIL